MFRQSDIGAKCDCGVPHWGNDMGAEKRYLVPKGYYGKFYYPNRYYAARWWQLTCEKCGNVREDFHVYRWSPDGDRTPIVPPFHKQEHLDIYRAIYDAIKAQMPE